MCIRDSAQAVANSIAKIDIASAGYQKAMAGNAKSTGSAKSAAEEYVESLKKEKEALQDVKNELDDQKDAYDSVIRAVQKALDKEIEALEKQKDALSDPDIEGSYGNRINFIQMEIDALNDLRDAKEREIAVEKAKAELERLKVMRAASSFASDSIRAAFFCAFCLASLKICSASLSMFFNLAS